MEKSLMKWIVAGLLLCISMLSSADAFTFADMPWGASKAEVTKKLAAKGYANIKTDKDGDLSFEGSLVGNKAIGIALFANNSLVKVVIDLVTQDRKAIGTYEDMKEMLTKKYGQPRSSLKHFMNPYYEGDGYEEQAIRLGKGSFSSLWGKAGVGGMVLEITENLTVEITYESAAWPQESDKRRAKAASDF